MNLTEKDLDELIALAEEQVELDAVIGTAGLADTIVNRRDLRGLPLPWGRTRGKFELRAGEVTIWAGDNGSGKSLLVGQVVAWLIAQGQMALIASMEMTPAETVWRMIGQCCGQVPPEGFVRDWCAWAEGKLWIYDRLDTVESDRVLRMIRAVAQRLGVQHVVIDSLVKCGVAQDGEGALTKQTQFVDKLQHLAKHLGIHIHLIAHTRKPERAGQRVTKHDVRGASQITDLADNVVLIERNRRKEEVLERQRLGADLDDDDLELLDGPDTAMIVAKQRHYSFEGRFALDYDRASLQFTPHGKGVLPWPDDGTVPPWRQS
jgi:twinkle protein